MPPWDSWQFGDVFGYYNLRSVTGILIEAWDDAKYQLYTGTPL